MDQSKRSLGGLHQGAGEASGGRPNSVGDQGECRLPAENVHSADPCIELNRRAPYGVQGVRREYVLSVSGRVVSLASKGGEFAHKPDAPRRGAVVGFSDRSRVRLHRTVASLPFEGRPAVFVTLTYPGEFPADGRVVKAHLRAFRQRWARRWGLPVGVWKLEFQRRGAPHLHLALLAPPGGRLGELRSWVARAWFGVVGSGDPAHERAGTQCDRLRGSVARYFAKHGAHGRDLKGYQNQVPTGIVCVGRFWGVWNAEPDWQGVALTYRQFVELRRVMRRWARSRRAYGRLQGLWVDSRGSGLWHLYRLCDWAGVDSGGLGPGAARLVA